MQEKHWWRFIIDYLIPNNVIVILLLDRPNWFWRRTTDDVAVLGNGHATANATTDRRKSTDHNLNSVDETTAV
jgi:hypothetical protein